MYHPKMDFEAQVPSSQTAAVLLSLSVLTVVLNALVIITIWKDPFRELKGAANCLILNLAVCDLLVGIPAEFLFGLLHWFPHHYKTVFAVAHTAMCFTCYASALTILGLAVERLIVISSPLRSTYYLTSTYLSLGILTIWIFAGLLAFLPSLGWDSESYRFFIADAFGLPILILIFCCYTRIYFLVRKGLYRDFTTEERRTEQLSLLTESPQDIEKRKRRERSVAFSVFILVGLFAVCWIPSFVLENINEFCGNCVRDKLHYVLQASISLHSLANPIAYSLRTAKFRRALWRICTYSAKSESPRQEVV
ncbi:Adenosine receptor A2a [Desmophyllum pertusum]|uniref:Adenosine receptor A2a n=1 Tax=Desmophyllum pertusum TaxID=174260 RepID=A0A9W9YEG5_9CNID|nr:Adenosine receptor A2a [Desmophyllum pertusum]